jgi:hypothetical protein
MAKILRLDRIAVGPQLGLRSSQRGLQSELAAEYIDTKIYS